MDGDFKIEDHVFDINQGSLSYLSKDANSQKWEHFEEANKQITIYWNELKNYIPFDIQHSINDFSNCQIISLIENKKDAMYVVKIGDDYHLIPRDILNRRNPLLVLNKYLSNIP